MPYRRKTTFYQSVSGSLLVTTATDDTTLVTVRNSSHTIFIQKIHVEITTGSASKTWTFTDSANTPIPIYPSLATDSINHFDVDFGPDGIPLTAGKNFVLDVSATGAAGQITWEGYQKITSAVAAASA